MKNPIIIPVKSEVASEHDLEINKLANLDFFLNNKEIGFYMMLINIK